LTLNDLKALKVSSATETICCNAFFLATAGLSCKSKQHLIVVALCKTKVAVSGSELFTE